MTSTERREREREQRRELFIDVAERAFFEGGYDGASIDDIARAAEFSKRTVYLYFRDKRELFHAVVLRGLTKLHGQLRAALTGERSGMASLRALGNAYYRFFQDERPTFDLLLAYEMRDYHYAKPRETLGRYELQCQEMNDQNSELVHQAVRRAIEDGADPGGLEPPQVTLILWSQVLGTLQVIARRESILESAYGLGPRRFFESAFEASLAGIFQRARKGAASKKKGRSI